MKATKFILILMVAFTVFTSCKKKGGLFCYSSKGDTVVETRDVSSFSSVDLAMAADVYIQESNEYSVEIHASQNLQDIIKTKIKGDRLIIELKNNKCLKGSSDVDVYVTAPNFDGLSVSGAGTIYAFNKLNSPKMDIDISGAGEIEIDSLLNNDFSAKISGSGEMFVVGLDTSDTQEIKISGSGSFKGFAMPALSSDIRISGSGDCEVNVINSLSARISGSGDVRYMGKPLVDSDISGAGTIKKY